MLATGYDLDTMNGGFLIENDEFLIGQRYNAARPQDGLEHKERTGRYENNAYVFLECNDSVCGIGGGRARAGTHLL